MASSSSSSSSLQPGAHYFWDKLTTNEKMVLPPLQQHGNDCGVASVLRQIEYQVRVDMATIGKELKQDLFDHDKWHGYLRNLETTIEPLRALEYALKDGVECSNGSKQKIDSVGTVIRNEVGWCDDRKFNAIVSWLDMGLPVVGVMYTHTEYDGQKPYSTDASFEISEKTPYHAVVIVGYFIVGDERKYGLLPGKYLIYQESQGEVYGRGSTLGDGLNIVHPCFIFEAFYGICELPNMLITKEMARRKMDRRKKELQDSKVNEEKLSEFTRKRKLNDDIALAKKLESKIHKW